MKDESGIALCIVGVGIFWMYLSIYALFQNPDNLFHSVEPTIHNFLLPVTIPVIWFLAGGIVTVIFGILYYKKTTRPKDKELYDDKGNNLLRDRK